MGLSPKMAQIYWGDLVAKENCGLYKPLRADALRLFMGRGLNLGVVHAFSCGQKRGTVLTGLGRLRRIHHRCDALRCLQQGRFV